jgi:hypothetical protein
MAQSYDRCPSCGAALSKETPAYAGYAAAGSSLYVGECCKQLVGELATHVYGHARMPITTWLRDNTTESLAHAQEAGEMIMRLYKRPALGIAALPTTRHNTIDEIITESVQREEAGVNFIANCSPS